MITPFRVSPLPWRERALQDPLAQALIRDGASDAEAAAVYAERCEQLRRDLLRVLETSVHPTWVPGAIEHLPGCGTSARGCVAGCTNYDPRWDE